MRKEERQFLSRLKRREYPCRILMKENYKHLYESTKYMLEKYQDEIVPGFRERAEAAESALKIAARGGCCQVCELDCADKGRTAACSAFRWNGKGE